MSIDAVLHSALYGLDLGIFIYFITVNVTYLVLLVASALEIRAYFATMRGKSRWRLQGATVTPRISILAPAYNEEATVCESLNSLLTLYYPNLEVIVVNDGSKDGTLEVLRQHFDLFAVRPVYRIRLQTRAVRAIYRSNSHPNLVVVDKENGGKADSLNAGLNIASGTLVCAIDADTLIEPDALQRMVRPFLLRSDVVASGGMIRVVNGCTVAAGRVVQTHAPSTMLAGIQAVEYLRAFLFGRLGWQRLGGNLVISGAFGLFHRDSMIGVGGYEHSSVGEDMELVVRLRRHGYENRTASWVDFLPDPVAWTEVPERRSVLGRQRDRWHRGLADVVCRHWRLLFNPRYGAMGMIVFPYFVFIELLAPVIEVVGLVGLILGLFYGVVNGAFAVLFFLVAYGLGILFSVFSLLLEALSFHRFESVKDVTRMLTCALIENAGFRQMTVYWRLRGLVSYLRGRKEWGAMERRGFSTGAEKAP